MKRVRYSDLAAQVTAAAAPERAKHLCRAADCPLPATFFRGPPRPGDGVCSFHANATERNWPAVTQQILAARQKPPQRPSPSPTVLAMREKVRKVHA